MTFPLYIWGTSENPRPEIQLATETAMTVRMIMILLYGAGGVPGRGEIPMIQIATLVQIDPKPVNLHRYMDESIPAIQKNLQKSRMCAALQEPWESCVLR